MKDSKNMNLNDGNGTKPVKQNKAGRSKHGMYTAAVSALVIAIVIVFNLVIGSLPTGTLEFDISQRNIYTVSDQSIEYLNGLTMDVDIVLLAEGDAIDERLLKLMSNYARFSSHVTFKVIDPVLEPTALETYNTTKSTVVVRCDETGKSKIINMAGFSGYEGGLILYDAMTYQYYQQLQAVALDVEGQLTSAIDKVTSDTSNLLYLLEGHNEAALGPMPASLISKANIDTTPLNLLIDGGVPADCPLIMCVNPTQDLADDEFDMLATYLRTGGNLLLFLDNTALSNFNALLELYGLQMQDGFVGDNDRYYQAYAQQYGIYCIYPSLSSSSDITADIVSDALVRGARGMLEITPQRRASSVTPFMTTSANGALLTGQDTTLTGQYTLGATVVETFEDKPDVQTRLTVITAIDILSDEILSYDNFSNKDIFLNAVTKNYSEVSSVSIPAKSLDITPITIGHPLFWTVLFVGLIPLAVLVGGFVYWNKRRRR